MVKIENRDVVYRSAKPGEKVRKISDGKGMYLQINPDGSKYWRLAYRFDGKQKLLALGVYPEVSLQKAREKRDDARELLSEGVDPSENKKAQKAAKQERAGNSFEVIAREWFSRQKTNWVDAHATRVISRLQADVFPWIGDKPVADLTAPDYLSIFRRIENRGALETAHRVRSICGQVQRYAIATGRAITDPTAALKDALPPVKPTHFAALTEPKDVAALLCMIDGYEGTFTVSCALKLAPLVFVRPGELRTAQWEDIDLDTAEWRFTVTKTNTQHIVPLSRQAVKILIELHALTGRSRYVFPGARTNGRPMSDNAINAAFRRMGIEKDRMSAHGFRAMARTILDEVLGERVDLIEHQLAHAVRDPNGRAYNRTAHLPERRKMMQRWSDYLDKLKNEKNF
ncbi:integrase arm-type DNA-binding domain-containing protein [Oxalobacter vibrioformis]|uniref:Integrase arm-type DNA-binding domain-containing protein n=1 Tax=Oxalobacter vibrioformis TaxID=933080 RepID=A0A9E9LW77_9BURK|nr:integrase arm-type DNA-binding domain-containing protein [Oxalobacter vibrioformis]WAW10371.1 integrase arm-type DNA-binding domain-containing protein [Oxalobacter vibrioformis]